MPYLRVLGIFALLLFGPFTFAGVIYDLGEEGRVSQCIQDLGGHEGFRVTAPVVYLSSSFTQHAGVPDARAAVILSDTEFEFSWHQVFFRPISTSSLKKIENGSLEVTGSSIIGVKLNRFEYAEFMDHSQTMATVTVEIGRLSRAMKKKTMFSELKAGDVFRIDEHYFMTLRNNPDRLHLLEFSGVPRSGMVSEKQRHLSLDGRSFLSVEQIGSGVARVTELIGSEEEISSTFLYWKDPNSGDRLSEAPEPGIKIIDGFIFSQYRPVKP